MHRVVTVAQEGAVLLDLAIPVHVFDFQGEGRYDHRLAGTDGDLVRTSTGLCIATQGDLRLFGDADTVVVPGYVDYDHRPSDALLDALRGAARRGVRLVSICTGAFTLAWAGLLDGRRATTHWDACDDLARMFPLVEVDSSVLYIDGGDVLTSGGVAAGLDLCLHVVRGDHGAAVATEIARRMVVAPHRDGGQAQFILQPVREPEQGSSVASTMAWALDHLNEPLDLGRMARVARMSVRTLSRRFREESGTSPLQWVLSQRVARAQELLETTTLTIESIAHRSGFRDAPTLRRHFVARVGTSPNAYRETFGTGSPEHGRRRAS
jgi:transcriptional regulator GlxA family with amidase domain